MSSTLIRSARAACLTIAFAVLGTSAAVAQDAIVGDWEGTIVGTPQGDIGMIVRVTAGEEGALAGSLDVPSQAGFGLALENVTFEEGVFSFEFSMAGPGTGYEGTLGEDGTISGMWTQGGGSIELNLAKSEG